jgi:Tol biopolymer transport system component
MKPLAAICTAWFLVTGSGVLRAQAEKLLESARHKEVMEGDLKGAIEQYRKIAAQFAKQPEVAAKALLQMGQCQEKLGQAEARKSYERIVREYAGAAQYVSAARARLAALGGAATEGVVRRIIDSSGECRYVTRDDQWAACSRKGNLYIRNLSSGKEMLAARDVHRYDLSALSSDGKWVAYNSTAAHGATLWLSAVDGSSRRKLEGPASRPRSVVFSNDNNALFVFSKETGKLGEIWWYPVQGGEGRKLYESENLMSVTSPVFSPDGQFVFYRAQTQGSAVTQIWVLPIKGGEPWELPVLKQGTPAGFTSDGKLVIHAWGSIRIPSLWTLLLRQGHVEGQPQLLARDVSLPGQYHPSGRFYYTRGAGRDQMLSAQIDGVVPPIARPATDRDEGRGRSPDYSPDGKLLTYLSDTKNGLVIVHDLQSSSDKEYQIPFRVLYRVRWYPDGSALLVTGSREKESEDIGVRLDLRTGDISEVMPAALAGPGGSNADASFNPTVSRDGRYIYYKRFYSAAEPRRVHRYEVSSGKEEEVYRAPAGDGLRLFSISPDGQQLAVVCSNTEGHWIGVAPLAGGEAKVIHRVPLFRMRGFSGLAWAADSKSIFFHTVSSENADDLWRISLDGSPAQRLLSATGIITSIGVHPNGREITFVSADSRDELWVMEGLK